MQLVAVYGSLKKGFYNHDLLGVAKKFKGASSVRGVMHLRLTYPTLTHKEDGFANADFDRAHPVEIYEISELAYEGISYMEEAAGYVPEEFETDWGPATMWWLPADRLDLTDQWIESYK